MKAALYAIAALEGASALAAPFLAGKRAEPMTRRSAAAVAAVRTAMAVTVVLAARRVL